MCIYIHAYTHIYIPPSTPQSHSLHVCVDQFFGKTTDLKCSSFPVHAYCKTTDEAPQCHPFQAWHLDNHGTRPDLGRSMGNSQWGIANREYLIYIYI